MSRTEEMPPYCRSDNEKRLIKQLSKQFRCSEEKRYSLLGQSIEIEPHLDNLNLSGSPRSAAINAVACLSNCGLRGELKKLISEEEEQGDLTQAMLNVFSEATGPKLPKIFEEAFGKDYWNLAVESQFLAWAEAAITNLRIGDGLASAIASCDVYDFMHPKAVNDLNTEEDEKIFWEIIDDWDDFSDRITAEDLKALAVWAIAQSSERTRRKL